MKGNFVGQVVGDDKIKIECSFSMMDLIASRTADDMGSEAGRIVCQQVPGVRPASK